MDETPGLSDQYRMASPWPMFVALGLTIAEVGILFNLFSVAVGGLLLFCGSIAGILREAEYVSTSWRALVALSIPVFAFGVGLLYADAQVANAGIQLGERAYAVLAAGAILLVGGVVGELFLDEGVSPV
jgi:hypothetical protein